MSRHQAWATAMVACLVVLASGLPLLAHPTDHLASRASLVGTTLLLASRRTVAWRVMRAVGLPASLPRTAVPVLAAWRVSITSRQAWATVMVACLAVRASGLPLPAHTTGRCVSVVSLVGTTLLLVSR